MLSLTFLSLSQVFLAYPKVTTKSLSTKSKELLLSYLFENAQVL